MALTRIKTDQITNLAVTNAKIDNLTIEGGKLANDLTYGSNFTISGNLIVNGATTTVDTTNTVASDPLIVLNRNAVGANANDIGLVMERGSSTNVAFVYKESTDEFVLISTSEVGTTTGTINVTAYQPLKIARLDADNIRIASNTISATNSNGNINITPNGTGIVRIEADAVNEGNLQVNGNVTLGNASGDGHLINGNVQITNGLNVSGGNNTMTGNLAVNGSMTIGDTNTDHHNLYGIFDIHDGVMRVENLQFNLNTISSVNTNGDINLDPNGTGDVVILTGAQLKITDLTQARVVFVGASGALVDSANFTFDTSTGNLVVSGQFNADNLRIDGNVLSSTNANGNIDITANGSGIVNIDNIAINNNTISSTNSNGNIALDPNGTGVTTVASDVYITGNLYVSGTETVFNVISSSVEDPVLHLGGPMDASILTNNDGMDRGIEFHHYNDQDRHGFFGFDNSTGEFTFIPQATESSLNIFIGSEGTARFGNVKVVSLTPNRIVYVGASDQLVDSSNLTFDGTTLSLTGTLTTTGQFNVDNLRLDGNTLSSTNTNGNIDITANGTGTVNIDNVIIDGNNIKTLNTDGSLTIDPNGTGNVVIATGAEFRVTDLTQTRVVFVGASGALKDDADFVYNSTSGAVSITGSLKVDNVTINSNVISSNVTNDNLYITPNGTGVVIIDNLQLDGNNITSSDSEITINAATQDKNFRVATDNGSNTLFVDGGNNNVGISTGTPNPEVGLHINTTNAMIVPTGIQGDRPVTGVAGMLRFNTTNSGLEVYNGADWSNLSTNFTIVTSQTFTGDGSTVAFTINESSSTASCLVAINGVLQVPTTSYGITGTTLTFTEAPESGDIIEVRKITTLATVVNLSDTQGYTTVETERTASDYKIRFKAGQLDVAEFDNNGSLSSGATFDMLNGTKTTYNQTAVTVGTSATVIDSFAKATYRTAKYIVQVTNSGGTAFESSEVLVVHNGTTATMIEYGVVSTSGSSLGTISALINSSNVELKYTGAASGNAVKVYATYMAA